MVEAPLLDDFSPDQAWGTIFKSDEYKAFELEFEDENVHSINATVGIVFEPGTGDPQGDVEVFVVLSGYPTVGGVGPTEIFNFIVPAGETETAIPVRLDAGIDLSKLVIRINGPAYSWSYAAYIDNIEVITSELQIPYEDTVENGVLTRTWTALDACGTEASAGQTIMLETVPPITCPADVTIQCDASTDPADTGSPLLADVYNCLPSVTYVDNVAESCAQSKLITRTWTVVDSLGNSASCDQLITLMDTVAPVLIQPADITISCDQATDPTVTGAATASDNCEVPTTLTRVIDFESFNPGDVVSGPGVFEDVELYYLSRDENDPLTAFNHSLGAPFEGARGVTHEVWQQFNRLSGLVADFKISGIHRISFVSGIRSSPLMEHSAYQELFVSSASGDEDVQNTTRYSFDGTHDPDGLEYVSTLTEDIASLALVSFAFPPPPLFVPHEFYFDLLTYEVDNIYYRDELTLGASPEERKIVRTWIVEDACGNRTTAEQTITVQYPTAPVLTIPSDTATACDEATDPSNIGEATVNVDCPDIYTISYTDVRGSGNGPNEEIIARTWTFKDIFGYEESGVQSITVQLGNSPRIEGSVWIDYNGDGILNESTFNDGMNGVTINLYEDSGSGPELVTSEITGPGPFGAQGYYRFDGMAPGTYTVEVDTDTLLVSYDNPTTPLSYEVTVDCGVQSSGSNFGFMQQVTAITLAWFTYEAVPSGNLIQWLTGVEVDSLGFNVYREDDQGNRTKVNTSFILAAGSASGAAYQLVDENPPVGSVYTYWLDEVDLSFNVASYGPATLVTSDSSVGGVVWSDYNGDGIANENLAADGLNDVVVTLYREIDGVFEEVGSVLTATDGAGVQGTFSFANLEQGQYKISVDLNTVPYSNRATTPSEFIFLLDSAQVNPYLEFGVVYHAPASLELFTEEEHCDGRKISWEILYAGETLGFNVFRSDEIDSERFQLNDAFLLYQGSDYADESYIDTTAEAGATYYYWVDVIDWSFVVSSSENPAVVVPPEDTDQDGMWNCWEILNGTNHDLPDDTEDADDDGLTNGEEHTLGTDPNDADSDDDGLPDHAEHVHYGTDPLAVDSDRDGLSDDYELYHQRFARVDAILNWNDAKTEAETARVSSHLATFSHVDEYDQMIRFVSEDTLYIGNIWLGAQYDVANTEWAWVDGTTWAYERWDTGLPDGETEFFDALYIMPESDAVEPFNWDDASHGAQDDPTEKPYYLLENYDQYTDPNNYDTDGDGLVDGYGGQITVEEYPAGLDYDGNGYVDGGIGLWCGPANK